MGSSHDTSSDGVPIVGIWHPPSSSRAVAAVLHFDRTRIVQARDAEGVPLTASDVEKIRVSGRVGSIARRVTFVDGSVFETADNDAIDAALRRTGRRGGSRVHEMERFRPRLALYVLLVVALGVGVYRYAVPLLVEAAIAMTPPAVPTLLSRSAMISLDRTLLQETKLPEAQRQGIAADFSELAGATPRGRDGYTLHFRGGGPIGPNAFALPDGTVVLTDELVELAADDAEAVLGVLAHEIGHVAHEHSLRRIYRAVGIAGLIMLIGGDIGSAAEDVLVQGAALMSLSYSRDQERDADRYAVRLMHAAGRDPMAISRFFDLLSKRLGDHGSVGNFLSTHPPTAERIEETRRYAEEVAAGR